MTRGKLITIEGIEGAGKSSAVQFIQDYLENEKIELVVTREPGGTEIAEEIRKVLLYPASSETMHPQTELLLMFACRAQLLNQCIKPALARDKWVLSDRYIDATYAYQGGGRRLSIPEIEKLDELIVNHIYPDMTLLLDVTPEVGLQRTEKRSNHKDRIEQERIDFFERVRAEYLKRAHADPARIKIIDANQSPTSVHTQIAEHLNLLFASVT